MLAAGMSIESHSRNHFTLKGQNDDYLVWQALGSLETLQYELGVRPRFISYPAGDYDQRTIDVFKSANYWGGLTTEQGTEQSSDHPFELERIRCPRYDHARRLDSLYGGGLVALAGPEIRGSS